MTTDLSLAIGKKGIHILFAKCHQHILNTGTRTLALKSQTCICQVIDFKIFLKARGWYPLHHTLFSTMEDTEGTSDKFFLNAPIHLPLHLAMSEWWIRLQQEFLDPCRSTRPGRHSMEFALMYIDNVWDHLLFHQKNFGCTCYMLLSPVKRVTLRSPLPMPLLTASACHLAKAACLRMFYVANVQSQQDSHRLQQFWRTIPWNLMVRASLFFRFAANSNVPVIVRPYAAAAVG